MAQTSDRMSKIAAKYTNFRISDISMMNGIEQGEFQQDVRSMAASCLRQDETKGLRGRLSRIFKS